MICRISMLLLILALSHLSIAQYDGYAGYGGGGGGSSGSSANVESSSENKAPVAPMAPPRVPMPADMASSSGSSLGYRPPPPPVRRDEQSTGQCSFDSSKWQIEPQSAIAHAIMFDRTTGLSCEECLQKCTEFQDAGSQWVCRTLTYDNTWKICDLFAVNGTESPYFLTQYHGRDYFVYLPALPPTDEQINGETKTEEASGAAGTVSAASAPAAAGASAPASSSTGVSEASSPGVAAPAPAPAAPAPAPESPALATPAPSGGSRSAEQVEAEPASQTKEAGDEQASVPTNVVSKSESSSSSYSSTSEVKSSSSKSESYQAVHRINVPKSGLSICSAGEIARYLRFEESQRAQPGELVGFVVAKTLEECAAACDRDDILSCASAVFSPSGCELSATSANHSNAGELSPSKNAIYLEKICLPEKLAKKTKLIYNAVSNYVMVGHVQEVADAKTLAECNTACLQSEKDFGFICKSSMWYPSDETQNCLLNTQSRQTLPDVFIPEDQGVNMVYYEILFEHDLDFKSNNLNSRFRDEPLYESLESKWTKWSKCKADLTGMRHRYLKCSEQKDVRKCPKESVMCRHLPAIQIQKLEKGTDCHAVLDSQGRKRCPHGIRLSKDGRKEYCRNPVNC
uniref:Apple domain-containing protein n=1 Tax=Panagrolaimus superbus TaxID=310955 RepID=A0A914YM06_9BILA